MAYAFIITSCAQCGAELPDTYEGRAILDGEHYCLKCAEVKNVMYAKPKHSIPIWQGMMKQKEE